MKDDLMASPTSVLPKQATPVSEEFWNVPNLLTLSRLGLSVVVFALMANDRFWSALIVFVLAALTDALDGYFARLLNQGTAIGRQLDPLVDKVIVCGAFIYLLSVPGDTGLAPWMVTTIVIRELLIQGLRSHLEGGGQPFGAKTAGKLKTLTQCLSISAILVLLALRPWHSAGIYLARDLLTWSAVGLTIYSGLGYFALAIPRLRGRSPSSSLH
ncbi:CDP-diacylglycerol--glycerol-3-phosphate 3-phosphatidyltransferase [Tundrisphaera lichenicola]|uniref:CDP-diacylglycerol--glycerol-3-phosphate 3-phosphatidyltransferase n=1 Tax=Tundrisphaera lichenicola TaxID=2029860 RepID=UPI003EB7477B